MARCLFPGLTFLRPNNPAFVQVDNFYSSISTSSPFAWPLCRALGLGTEASLSIICRETETMLSSISCCPTSEMSGVPC